MTKTEKQKKKEAILKFNGHLESIQRMFKQHCSHDPLDQIYMNKVFHDLLCDFLDGIDPAGELE